MFRGILFYKIDFKISSTTKIGTGFRYTHPYATIINADSIGNNCSIRNNIVIGNKFDGHPGRPKIGNNVYIGASVIIIGDIIIGDNCIIGAGSVITKNIPSNSTVVGNPQQILSK